MLFLLDFRQLKSIIQHVPSVVTIIKGYSYLKLTCNTPPPPPIPLTRNIGVALQLCVPIK